MEHIEPEIPIRAWLILLILILALGLVLGTLGGMVWMRNHGTLPVDPSALANSAGGVLLRQGPSSNVMELGPAEQDDYIILVAEAYSSDRDLKLARERLRRLKDATPTQRVEVLARSYAPQGDLIATNLAELAVALGSKDKTLLVLAQPPTPVPVAAPPAEAAAPPVEAAPASAAAPAVPTAAPSPTATSTRTLPPPTLTRKPPTSTPVRPTAVRPVAAPAAPAVGAPPPTEFYPAMGQIRNLRFEPAAVAPGQRYWHLSKLIYCDVGEKRFGCPDMPGGEAGTSIYVMTGGADIDAIRGGVNYGSRPDVIGDKKAANDMCQCTFTFLVSDYRISVRGAPSDAAGGFGLITSNGSPIPDGHAHVRYFLYFSLVTR